jgi:hypothetical protein
VEAKEFGPITGTYPPEGEEADVRDLSPHEGFNRAWNDALDKAAKEWHREGEPPIEVPVVIEYRARVDIWNPGGIGQYHVSITPAG